MWLLPTYNRPKQVQATLDSIARAGGSSRGVVYIDGSNLPEYDGLSLPPGWTVLKGEKNRGVCAVLNHFFSLYPRLGWYGFISDDSIVRTPQWEEKLLEHATDSHIVHSADGWRTESRIHGAVVFGGELLRALGWWALPGLVHCFCDDVWETIAEKKNLRKYIPEVMVEHLHMWNGKAPIDPGYVKAYESFDADEAVFLRWKKEGLEECLKRLSDQGASD